MGIANELPSKDVVGMPRLTVEMVAKIQDFSDEWHFVGKKTPPPVAHAVAQEIANCLTSKKIFVAAS